MLTSITVRVQAKGGKFLADDVGGAEVTVHDAHTGALLGGGVVRGTDSGNLSDSLPDRGQPTGQSLSLASDRLRALRRLPWLDLVAPRKAEATTWNRRP